MKRVLITGANSYIGLSVEKWLSQFEGKYKIFTLDMRDVSWNEHDFSQYDVLFHVAAIVHKNEKNVDSNLYYSVNRDLPIKLAEKAKREGVSQFIFLSSMSVYGEIDECITAQTKEKPVTHYGKSKLEAEVLLKQMDSNQFKIAILRPPMVYGPNSTGNYKKLSKLSNKIPFFPKIENQRSMVYIDNLAECIRHILDKNLSGLYFPQNKEYVNTSCLVKEIRKVHNKQLYLTTLFNPLIKLLFSVNQIKKVFGNLVYDKGLSQYNFDYQIVDFESSIIKSEKR